MKLTIEAFGTPFVAEYVSDDWRIFSSREKCLEFHSFPYLKAADDELLRLHRPVWVRWLEIIDGRWEGTVDMSDADIVKGGYLELHDRSRYDDSSFDHIGPEDKQRITHAERIIKEVLYEGRPREHFRYDYQPKYRGVFVLAVNLKSGNELFLRPESGRFQQMPIAAENYFLTQKQVALADALAMKAQPITPEVESIAKDLLELGSLLGNREEREALGKMLGYLKHDRPEIDALIKYAAGESAEQVAERLNIHPRTIGRWVSEIPEPYKRYFVGSPAQRKQLNTLTPTQLQKLIFQIDDDACIGEQFSDNHHA